MFGGTRIHLAQRRLNLGVKILLFLTLIIGTGLILTSPSNYVSELRGNRAQTSAMMLRRTVFPEKTENPTQPSRFKIVLSRQPYFDDSDCSNFSISLFQRNTFELVALASYPGSGNTWLRHLIEFSTGIFTGSVYFDEELYGRGFYGEKEPWYAGSTVVQKLHFKYSPEFVFSKGILLLREPYEAIVSFVQFLEAGHLGSASPSTFKHNKWQTYVMGQTYSWISLAKSWLESPAKLLVVHYENLLLDAEREMQRICEFLNVPCVYLKHPCFRKHMDGHFHRRKHLKPVLKMEDWVRERINDGIDYLSKILVKRGHPAIPVNLYHYYGVNDKQTNKSVNFIST